MSLADVILRSDTLLHKYEKYDSSGPPREKTDDPFNDEYLLLTDKVQDLTLKAEEIANEKNRAMKAALNADLRKAKATLLEQALPTLAQLAMGSRKQKLTQAMVEERMHKIDELQVAIEDIPDGAHPSRRPQRTFNGAPGSKSGEITIDISKVDGRMTNADYYKHSEETQAFQSEWDEAKKRQDQQLQSIEAGLGTLKEIGGAMNEELNRHDVLIDEANTKIDEVTKELQTNNMRLKGLVSKVRSGRNFVIDIILICILLAIGLYIYNMFK